MAHIHTLENGEVIVRDDWGKEDVRSVAFNMGYVLTQAEIHQVMDIVVKSFDASVGINWDSFETAIELVLAE